MTLVLIPTMPHTRTPINNEQSVPLNDGWIMTVDGVASISTVELPVRVEKNRANNNITIERALPDNFFMGATLLFRTSQQFLDVYLEGDLIYSYHKNEDQPFAKTSGSAWHFVRLPSDYTGKNLTVQIRSPYDQYSASVNEAYFGTKSSHVFKIFTEFGVSSLVGLVLAVMGIAGFLTYFIVHRFSMKNISLFYLSMFSLCSGIWVLCESRMLQLFYNNPFYIYCINFICFYSIPIYLGMFMLTNYELKNPKPLRVIIAICTGFLMLAVGLQVIDVFDFIEILPFFHGLLVCCIFVVTVTVAKEFSSNHNIRLFAYGLIIISATTIVDVAMFYTSVNQVAGTFTQIGLLLFVLLIAVSAAKYFIELSSAKALNEALASLAYTDALTGLKNRMAFQEELEKIDIDFDEQHNSLHDLSIAMCDINNLKYVNDTFGHKEGDVIIKAFADIITQAFGNIGDIYKIGGDEFAVLLHSCTQELYDNAVAKVDMLVEKYNIGYTKTPLSIAIGLATYTPSVDLDVNFLLTRADAEMYERKDAQKRLMKSLQE